ncbi:transposase [Streptomyces sp. NPDC058642]|uniref:transposase n=1 Tax=Streptomyces sp. NPDC058642 TaxID=3346572 RepID=UPI0036600468
MPQTSRRSTPAATCGQRNVVPARVTDAGRCGQLLVDRRGSWPGPAVPPAPPACREEDAARDVMRAFLARRLGADGGVLILDETGQTKKGTRTAAVGRQYPGTIGRDENVIVAVHTTYAAKRGHTDGAPQDHCRLRLVTAFLQQSDRRGALAANAVGGLY